MIVSEKIEDLKNELSNLIDLNIKNAEGKIILHKEGQTPLQPQVWFECSDLAGARDRELHHAADEKNKEIYRSHHRGP